MDSILIQNGTAHQIWPGKAKASLPELHPSIVDQIVEVVSDTVHEKDNWDGSRFSTPIPKVSAPRRDLISELDAEKTRVGRLETTLIEKGIIIDADIAVR